MVNKPASSAGLTVRLKKVHIIIPIALAICLEEQVAI